MENKIYLVKNLNPWMMDELETFAQFTTFQLILLRKPSSIYYNRITDLRSRGISIPVHPFRLNWKPKEVLFTLRFFLQNTPRFYGLKNFIFGIKSLYWFIRLDKKIFINVISIHAQFATQAAILSLVLKRYFRNQLSYSFTFHAHDIYFSNRWFSLLAKEAQSIFSISLFNVKYVDEHYSVDTNKIFLSYLGVQAPTDISPKANPVTPVNIGFLSWMEPKKGLFYLLEAGSRLKQEQIPFMLHIGGDGPLLNKAKAFVKSHRLNSQVIFYGRLDIKGKRDFYRKLDVFVMPSLKLKHDMDGIPVVLMEAIAFGLPLIATNISGLPEICIHEKNGLLVDERNSSQIKQAIEKILQMDSLKNFSEMSLKIASNKFDIRANCHKKLQILNWL